MKFESLKFCEVTVGRKIAFSEFGDPLGQPVLYFHGSPGSRLEGQLFSELFANRGLRLIAPDRPGMGKSDFSRGLTWLDQAEEMTHLADTLGLDQFYVMGYSGGGTLAQACAYAQPKRVRAAWLVGSWAPVSETQSLLALLAPLDRFFFKVGKNTPWLFNLPFYMFLISARYMSTQGFLNSFQSSMSEADRQMAQSGEIGKILHQDVKEAFSQGVRGPGYDALIQYLDWGFDIREIQVPVHILHGTEDKFAPFPFAEYLHQHIPNSTLHKFVGDGHFAIHQRIEIILG